MKMTGSEVFNYLTVVTLRRGLVHGAAPNASARVNLAHHINVFLAADDDPAAGAGPKWQLRMEGPPVEGEWSKWVPCLQHNMVLERRPVA